MSVAGDSHLRIYTTSRFHNEWMPEKQHMYWAKSFGNIHNLFSYYSQSQLLLTIRTMRNACEACPHQAGIRIYCTTKQQHKDSLWVRPMGNLQFSARFKEWLVGGTERTDEKNSGPGEAALNLYSSWPEEAYIRWWLTTFPHRLHSHKSNGWWLSKRF